ncbi:phosphotransferase [Streptomyces agglomeratus]|uniref:phosphotransferase enzyme family protein n=1 Tax=Streptomyces agglomeratus TaxID=285458 RepID=UPI00086C3D18|nr:phosphotransferase [Streptomyces agglomeratus]OEJ63011.1 phosphotransferase [Streptomyces agglomeratus]
MREEVSYGDEILAKVLSDRFGVHVAETARVQMGTETVNRRVTLTDGQRVFVKQYRVSADLEHAQASWDMSAYCRAARVPVPRAWIDRQGNTLTRFEDAAWVVMDEAPGRVATDPLTVPRAQHTGLLLGRMHRVLASYPRPARVRQTRWRTADVEEVAASTETVLARAATQEHPRLEHLHVELAQLREDLRTHAARLRDGLPDHLVAQAGHADFTRTNLLVQEDMITAILDFQGEMCLPAWELGRAAFDPRTVANSPSWMSCALRLIEAYRAENPGLPLADVRASARIALLYMLFSFYGATTAEYGLPAEAAADLRQHWVERQVAIRRMLSSLDELESALDAIGRSN